VSAQCNYSSLPFPLGPHSSLLFHVKHFLEKKCFFAQQSYRIFGKNPEILSGWIPKCQLRTGKETRILMVCEGALIWPKKEKNQDISAGGFSRF
jgi:hypothetical protein